MTIYSGDEVHDDDVTSGPLPYTYRCPVCGDDIEDGDDDGCPDDGAER